MGLLVFSKMGAELSFLFAISAVVSLTFNSQSSLFAALAILVCTAQICYFVDMKYGQKKRFFPLALALICIALAQNLVDVLQLAAMFAICLWMVWQRRYYTDYCEYLDVFKANMWIIGGFLTAFVVLNILPGLERSVIPYLILYFIFSFLTLSLLRHTESTLRQRKFQFANIAILSSGFATAWGMSTDGFYALAKSITGAVYQYVVMPIFVAIGFVAGAIIMAISSVLSFIFNPNWNVEGVESYFNGGMVELDEKLEVYGSSPTFDILVKIVFAIAVIYVIYRLFCRLFVGKNNYDMSSGSGEIRQTFTKDYMQKEKLTPAEYGVRNTYKKFLGLCTKRGMTLKKSDTTCDIQTRAAKQMVNPAYGEALRNIYINVRYGENTPSREDSQNIKKIYAQIKKNRQEDDNCE